jgi:hypothetical protein
MRQKQFFLQFSRKPNPNEKKENLFIFRIVVGDKIIVHGVNLSTVVTDCLDN